MKLLIVSVTLFFLFALQLFPTHAEVPFIANFSKIDYSASGQNWGVSSDSQGNIYVGNSYGLLRFNGDNWMCFSLPGNTYVRSVMYTPDVRIYVGSYEEFGYYEQDIYGQFHYISLSQLIPSYTFHNDEIWSIISSDNKIYFRSFSSYFVYDGETVIAKDVSGILTYFDQVNGQIYATIQSKGLSVLKDGRFEIILPQREINNDEVVGVLPFDGKKLIIATSKNGLFLFDGDNCIPWKNEANDILKKVIVNHSLMTGDSIYVIGTISDGVYALKKTGELIWNVNTSNGLQNNTVLGLTCVNNNIWLALDNGISFIQNNSQIRFINSFKQDIGSVYSALFKDDYLYLATNQGLFFSRDNAKNNIIEPMPGLVEQTWSLSVFDEQLICGNNNGTFEIIEDKAIKLSDTKGATCIRKAFISDQEILIQSTYTLLNIYRKNKSGKWIFSHTVSGFMQPIRHIEVDLLGNIWAVHFYRGFYRIQLSSDLKQAQEVTYYPSLSGNNAGNPVSMFKAKERVIFKDGAGFYTYDTLNDSIMEYVHSEANSLLRKSTKFIISSEDDTYWFVEPDEFLHVYFKDKKAHVKRQIPFSQLYSSFPDRNENVILIGDSKYLFCLDNGIAILDEKIRQYTTPISPEMRIESVQIIGEKDETTFLPVTNSKEILKLNYSDNNLMFEVAYPHDPSMKIHYTYSLIGPDTEYSSPTTNPEKEYNRLSPGIYEFKSSVLGGNTQCELASVSYKFEIKPPFYASTYAYLIYFILGIGFIVGIILGIQWYIRRNEEKIEQEQKKIFREEKERQEREIMRLENEKLENDLNFKSKEMASSTISIIKKNEVLSEIKSELQEQKEKLGTQFPNKYYDKLIRLIDSNLSSDDDWAVFQTNFDRIHENFFRHLKATYHDLTPNDLKLCALLRLNMNTKDIANLMNITVRGVEVARYRLRKKLNLSSEKNLVDFMIEFK